MIQSITHRPAEEVDLSPKKPSGNCSVVENVANNNKQERIDKGKARSIYLSCKTHVLVEMILLQQLHVRRYITFPSLRHGSHQ
jgi:hypothetical protein